MDKTDLSQVVGTLKHGELFDWQSYGKNRKKYIIGYIIFVSVFVVGMIGGVVGCSLEQIKNSQPLGVFVGILAVIIIGCLILPVIISVLFARNEIIRNAILKWSEDGVELYAHSKCVGEQGFHSFDPLLGPSFAKIEVSFELNRKRYKKMSGKTQRLGTADGFSRVWLKYRDRAIRIIYSPKYDEIIVLKDKENK